MTKIDIISGFLGAGKTTFIKKLLQEAISGEQVVLIENEFGEIGIDGGFLKDAGIEIREMNSGCICCSLVGDFGASLEEVLTKYKPDRVIIEPSGVGKLSDVMKAVVDVAAKVDVTLNSAVTIVDAAKCRMYMKNFGEFFNNQIENAGTVVLSRTDIAPENKVNQAVEMIREHNSNASIITTPCEELTGSQLLEIIEKQDNMIEELLDEVRGQHYHQHDHHDDSCGCGCGHDHGEHEEHDHGHHHHEDGTCSCGHDHGHDGGHDHEEHHHDHEGSSCGCGHDHDNHHHDHDHEGASCGCGQDHDHDHHHHADEVFTSWGIENAASITKEALDKILDELAYGDLYGEVLRAKGQWLYFDLVPEQYEIRNGAPDYTGKICVIGAKLNEEELKKAFGR
jgi:G3E family GTPase